MELNKIVLQIRIGVKEKIKKIPNPYMKLDYRNSKNYNTNAFKLWFSFNT
jgi:hypothetical protein